MKERGSGCADNLRLRCGMSGDGNFISAAIASASRRFFGAGRAIGCSSPRRSRACLLQEWFRRDQTVRGWIMSLLFPRSRVRGPVLKECNFCRQGIACASRREVSMRVPVIAERAYWEMDFPAQGEEVWGDNPSAWWMNSSGFFCRRWRNGCARMYRSDHTSPGGVDSSMILALACRLKGPGDQHLHRAGERAGV